MQLIFFIINNVCYLLIDSMNATLIVPSYGRYEFYEIKQ